MSSLSEQVPETIDELRRDANDFAERWIRLLGYAEKLELMIESLKADRARVREGMMAIAEELERDPTILGPMTFVLVAQKLKDLVSPYAPPSPGTGQEKCGVGPLIREDYALGTECQIIGEHPGCPHDWEREPAAPSAPATTETPGEVFAKQDLSAMGVLLDKAEKERDEARAEVMRLKKELKVENENSARILEASVFNGRRAEKAEAEVTRLRKAIDEALMHFEVGHVHPPMLTGCHQCAALGKLREARG